MITKRQRKRLLVVCCTALSVIVVAGILLPAMKSSNCGGNSAAMAAVRSAGAAVSLVLSERDQDRLDLASLESSERKYFDQIAGLSWLGDGTVLVNPRVDFTSTNEFLMAVCDRAYRNVPQKLIGKSPPTHAALFSDRGAILISVEEFDHLDLSGFIDVRTLEKASRDMLPGMDSSKGPDVSN